MVNNSEVKTMKRLFPWYDSQWLSAFETAKSIIQKTSPQKLASFTAAFKPLKTREDFEVIKLPKVFNQEILEKSKDIIKNLEIGQKETHEIFRLGRFVIHNHPFFNQIHESVTEMVSELVKEEVEATYNFLSLYNNLGVCAVHMDSPEAKYTFDICIEQSIDWKIFISQRQDWKNNFEYTYENWHQQIINDPKNHFTEYSLKSGDGIIFSGSSQWHYRNPISDKANNNFCNLIFFHFTPKGMKKLINPQNWAEIFEMPELKQLTE